MIKCETFDTAIIEAETADEAKEKAQFLIDESKLEFDPSARDYNLEEVEDVSIIDKPDETEVKISQTNIENIEEIKEAINDDENSTLLCTYKGCIDGQAEDGEFCDKHGKSINQ